MQLPALIPIVSRTAVCGRADKLQPYSSASTIFAAAPTSTASTSTAGIKVRVRLSAILLLVSTTLAIEVMRYNSMQRFTSSSAVASPHTWLCGNNAWEARLKHTSLLMQAATRQLRTGVRIAATSTLNAFTALTFGAWAALMTTLHFTITAITVRTQLVTYEKLQSTASSPRMAPIIVTVQAPCSTDAQ